jgi:hypothetical protein
MQALTRFFLMQTGNTHFHAPTLVFINSSSDLRDYSGTAGGFSQPALRRRCDISATTRGADWGTFIVSSDVFSQETNLAPRKRGLFLVLRNSPRTLHFEKLAKSDQECPAYIGAYIWPSHRRRIDVSNSLRRRALEIGTDGQGP